MMYIEQATVETIVRSDGMTRIECITPGANAGGYRFTAEIIGADSWADELRIGAVVPVQGKPYPLWNHKAQRYELCIVADQPGQGAMPRG